MWVARIRTPQYRLHDPIPYQTLTLVDNYNEPAMLSITGYRDRISTATAPGSGIVLNDEAGNQRFSGILTSVERHGNGDINLIYASDLMRLRFRHIWPKPDGEWSTAGQSVAYDKRTGPAETRLLHFVDRNAGPSARPERRITRLRVPTSQGRGVSRTSSCRFQNLGEHVAKIAEQGNLRVWIEQTYDASPFHTWLDLRVEETPDLSSWARFGTPEGGGPALLAEDWRYKIDIPTATTILSAGQGQKTARALNWYEGNQDERNLWGQRIEFFIDQRGTEEAAEIQVGMEEAFAENVGEREISAPLGRSNLDIGTDIPLGAWVAVIIDGERIVDRIRQITTTMGVEEPKTVVPLIGTPDVGLQTPTQKKLSDMYKRISNMERNV